MADSKISRAWVVAIGLISVATVISLILTLIKDTPTATADTTPKTDAISVTKSDITIEGMDESEIGGDCGCYFYYSRKPFNHKDNKFVFYYPFEHRAVMKINGKLIHMKNHKYRDQQPEIDKTGELEFTSKTTQVKAQFRLVAECPANSDSCEGADYDGTLDVKHNDKDISLPIWGYCGC